MKKALSKGTELIDVDEETPIPSPVNISPTHSPQNSPVYHFEGSPSRRSPSIDPFQQQIYDYVESLEKKNASMNPEPSVNPQ